ERNVTGVQTCALPIFEALLHDIQQNLFNKALAHREEKTSTATSLASFKETLEDKGGFIKAMWCGDVECEENIREQTGATSRCIPFEQERIAKTCVSCGKDAQTLVYW